MTTAREDAPTADEQFGYVVNNFMFRQRISQTKLAATLKCHPSTLGKKLHGERPWTLDDMIAVADALRVDLRDLLGEMWRDDPASAVVELPRLDSNQQHSDYKSDASVINLREWSANRMIADLPLVSNG